MVNKIHDHMELCKGCPEKRYEDKIARQEADKERKIREMEESIKKMEKYYKEEIADMRKRELELAEIIASKEH